MKIDLLPMFERKYKVLPMFGRDVKLKYRGISRVLTLSQVKASYREYDKILNMYFEYIDWTINSYEYSEKIYYFLKDFQTLLLNHRKVCEIIFYNDTGDHPVHNNVEFLGYDVFGDYLDSPLQEGYYIEEYYQCKLNDNGLFTTLEDANEFCLHCHQ